MGNVDTLLESASYGVPARWVSLRPASEVFTVTGNVDTLVESASYGVRWILLRPASEGPAPRSRLP